MIHTTTNSGLHDFVQERVLTRFARPTIRAVDLGTGPGTTAARLSGIFFDLWRQFLPRAGLQLREHFVFPPNGYQLTRKPLAWAFRLASQVLSGTALVGDNHVFVLEIAEKVEERG